MSSHWAHSQQAIAAIIRRTLIVVRRSKRYAVDNYKFLTASTLTIGGIVATLWLGINSLNIRSAELQMVQVADIQGAFLFNLSGLKITATYDPRLTSWDDRPIQPIKLESIRLAIVRIENIGNAAFEFRHGDSPFRIWLESEYDGRLLAVERMGKPLPSLLEIASDWQSFELSTRFLNPGESFVLHVVYIGEEGALKGNARLRDHPIVELHPSNSESAERVRIRKRKESAQRELKALFAPMFFGLVFCFVFVGYCAGNLRRHFSAVIWAVAACVATTLAYFMTSWCVQFDAAEKVLRPLFVITSLALVPVIALALGMALNHVTNGKVRLWRAT